MQYFSALHITYFGLDPIQVITWVGFWDIKKRKEKT